MNRPMIGCAPRVVRVELASLYPLFEAAYALLLEMPPAPPAREQLLRFQTPPGKSAAVPGEKAAATTANADARRVDVR